MMGGLFQFRARHLKADELIDFPGGLSTEVLHEIDRFWSLGQRYHELGYLHRRGYLFYGSPGCGKSSLVHKVVQRIVEAGHVAFLCEYPPSFVAAVSLFRSIEKDRPCVCVFEDIDTLIECHGDAELLQWLDGAYQIDRVVNIATTNYPEQLDRRIVTRPRRFDRIVKISAITAEARRAYLHWKLPNLSEEELEHWVDQTQDLSFAALSEVVIRTACLGTELEEVVEMLKAMEERPPSSSECDQPVAMGFRPTRERNGSRRPNRS